MPIPLFVPPLLDLAGDLLGGLFGQHSQEAANRANLKNSREQRAWEEMMSNTAVARRAADIEKAGGNRALAFTNGQEASTPSYQPAHAEPTVRPGQYALNATAKMVAALQAQQIKAGTALTTAQADVASAQAENIRQNTAASITTAKESAQRTTNLEQELERIKASLAGQLTQNEIAKITEGTARKTQSDQIAIVSANLRRAKAEATSAEKKATLDQALIDLMNFGKDKVSAYLKSNAKQIRDDSKPIQHQGTPHKNERYNRKGYK